MPYTFDEPHPEPPVCPVDLSEFVDENRRPTPRWYEYQAELERFNRAAKAWKEAQNAALMASIP